jgi:outer membrane autotransporter protein
MASRRRFAAAFLEDPATQFQIVSAEQARDSILAKVGMGAQVSKNVVLFLDYNGVFNSTATAHGASAGLRATW